MCGFCSDKKPREGQAQPERRRQDDRIDSAEDAQAESGGALMADHVFTEEERGWMRQAMAQARQAYALGEVPVGAVIVDAQGNVVSAGYNRTIIDHDPTAHAEIVALREAARLMGNYRLPGLRLFVTLEPCAMCLGAMLHARLREIVFAAPDPKTGSCGGLIDLSSNTRLNHQTGIRSGLLADECSEMLRRFFRERRQQAKGAADPAKR